MKTITVTDQASLQDVLQQAEEKEVLLMKDGRAVAVVMPFDDDDADWYARERDQAFIESLRLAREQVKQGRRSVMRR